MIYEATVSYVVIDKNGNDKTVKENVIIENAYNFASAESTAYIEYESTELTDLDVIAIKRSKIREIINKRTSEKEFVYTADIADIQINEDGEEVELVYKIALFALSMDDAYFKVKEMLKQGYSMIPISIKKTKIKDVIQ